MWTDQHRTRHDARLKDVGAQTVLDEVARFQVLADPPSSTDTTPARLVLAALAWHLRVGGARRTLPARFPTWRMVYGCFRSRIDKGLFASLMRALARRVLERRWVIEVVFTQLARADVFALGGPPLKGLHC